MTDLDAPLLVGRDDERSLIDSLLGDPAPGVAALLLEGDAGIGKSALWREGLRLAGVRRLTVLRAVPSEGEQDLAYVGLSDLLDPVDDATLDSLPEPQSRALRLALLRLEEPGSLADPRTVATGFLGVLRALARVGPVVLAIDDVQWLDRSTARVVEFALRRAGDLQVRVLLARRDHDAAWPFSLDRQPGVRTSLVPVGPLSVASLFHVLRGSLGQAFARPTLTRIAAWSGGNPLLAMEIGKSVIARGGSIGPEDAPPFGRDVTRVMEARLASLPSAQRRTLLVAALLERPTSEGVDDTCRRLGWPAALPADPSVVAADRDGIRFAHPLVAASSVALADEADRLAVHGALAVTAEHPEARARHLALSTDGADRAVAGMVELAAAGAAARGAPEVAIDLLDLACRLTPQEDRGALQGRQWQLGEVLARSGESRRAREALAGVVDGPVAGLRSRSLATLARLELHRGRREEAQAMAERALAEAGSDPELRALAALSLAAAAPTAERRLEMARQAADQAPATAPVLRSRAIADMVEATVSIGGVADPQMMDEAVRLEGPAPSGDVRESAAATRAWLALMDDRLVDARSCFEELVKLAADRGDESSLGDLLLELAQVELRAGRWADAERQARESARLAEQSGHRRSQTVSLVQVGAVAVLRGDDELAHAQFALADAYVDETDDPFVSSIVAGNRGLMALGRRDPATAATCFAEAAGRLEAAGLGDPALGRFQGDRLEALVALGALDRAAELADEMERQARATGRRRVQALVERGRGMIAERRGHLDVAVSELRASREAFVGLDMPFEAARSELALGIVHRRRREKRAAHDRLSAALAQFESLGARAWAARASEELGRVGLRPRAPSSLTEGEAVVARLAAAGHTNREIAELASISPRTVEGVLGRVFTKLDLRSRSQLARALDARPDDQPG